MHRVRFAQGWPWWFKQHLDIRVCGVKLREHFAGFRDGNFTFFQNCPKKLSWCLADMSPQQDGTVVAYEAAWHLDIGKPRCPHPCSNVCYQIHFTNLSHNAIWGKSSHVCWLPNPFLDVSHNATWGNHHMYVGYQIHFSNLFHNATWGNHHMYVGYQIHFTNLSHNATCITCMLVTKSISRFFFIMQPGGIITCMLVTKSISRGVLMPDSSRSCHTRGVKHGTDNCDRYNWTRHGQLLTKVWQEQCCLFLFFVCFCTGRMAPVSQHCAPVPHQTASRCKPHCAGRCARRPATFDLQPVLPAQQSAVGSMISVDGGG